MDVQSSNLGKEQSYLISDSTANETTDAKKASNSNTNTASISSSKSYASERIPLIPVKPQYVRPYEEITQAKKKESDSNSEMKMAVDEDDPDTEVDPELAPPPAKRSKQEKQLSRHAERKAKVQRPVGADFPTICNATAQSEKCENMETTGQCKWSHDLDGYFKNSPQPVEGPCPSFRRFGRCRFGLVCLFRGDHSKIDEITGKLVNIVDGEKWLSHINSSNLGPGVELKNAEQIRKAWNWNPNESNHVGKDLLITLKKHQYKFIKSVIANHQYKTKQNSPNRSHVIIPKEPEKKVDFKGKLILAPLTTIGNLPFRRICKRYGADITIGEMALTHQLLAGAPQEWALTHRHDSEDVFGVQIAGNHVDQCANVVEFLNKQSNVDFIDLNVGCPVELMCQQGLGSALLGRITRLEDIVTAMNQSSAVPITVKVRIGRDWNHPITHAQIAPVIHKWGASALTIHGRSKEQRYRLEANWDYIEQCADVCQIPVIGNGDIYSYEEAESRLASGKVSSLMIARGAIIKPWIFTEIKERRHWDIRSSERFEILRDFTNFGLEHWGSDAIGVEKTRYFLLNWLSMLNRYTPVGILERVPIKIGQKTQSFWGRDDMETMMASNQIDDFIKISSMLLGPPPSNFNFEPKHKAGG